MKCPFLVHTKYYYDGPWNDAHAERQLSNINTELGECNKEDCMAYRKDIIKSKVKGAGDIESEYCKRLA